MTRELFYMQAVNEALKQEMERDENIFVAGEDVALHRGIFGITIGLHQTWGDERVLDTPISEAAIIGLAVGSAAVSASGTMADVATIVTSVPGRFTSATPSGTS